MSHTKIRALQQWCKALVDGYKDVNITNMSSSWRDGLAFCALIHRFRPDLINFDALSKHNVYDNNQLAFTVAESIGIAALLEAKDMYDLPVPDKLSVITYVASMHNYFKDKEKLGGPGVSSYKGGNVQIGTKRHQDNDPLNTTEPKRSTPDQSEEKTKTTGSSPARQRSPADDLCTLCGGKVYLIEKQIDNGKLYHRSCFRSSYMSPASKILSRSVSNGAGGLTTANNEVSVPEVHAKVENGEKSKSPTKGRLYEKRKEQIQKAEEKIKAEKQKEKELYEKRQNTPSALRNHLKKIDNQSRENSRSSSDSPASRSSQSQLFSKSSSPERDNTSEQPSWAQTKLRKVFDDPVSGGPTVAASPRRDSSSSAEKKQSRGSSPSSPVLMMQVTSRTMEDRQYKASKSVTKSSTNLEAEAGKTQLVSGLLKSLATVRQRQGSTSTISSTSPPPQSPAGFPPFSKVSAPERAPSPVPTATNSLSLSQPLNSLPSTPAQKVLTSTPMQAKTRNEQIRAKNEAFVTPNEQPRSVARVKAVIKSTNPETQPSTETPVSVASTSSKITNENSVPDSVTKPKASTNTTETSFPRLVSSAKSNITSESSHFASAPKSNVSKIASESSPSHSVSPTKSKVSKIASESSPSRSVSPAKSNISKIASESSPSRSVSPAKSNISKIASESSSYKSGSPTRSGLSNLSTPPLQTDSPTRSVLSKTSIGTSSISPPTTDSTDTTSDKKPQSLLQRIEQYSKVAAGVEKPPSEPSPIREIILTNNDHDTQGDRQSSPKQNTFTTTATTITIKKPLASESTKERNTVGRHITSPPTPKRTDDKPEALCMPAPVVKTYRDKNGQTSGRAEITKDIKRPSLVSNLSSKTQPDKSSATAYDKNGQTSGRAEFTKDVKQPSLVSNLSSKTQPDKSSATAYDKNGQTSGRAEFTKDVKRPSLVSNLSSKNQPDKSSATAYDKNGQTSGRAEFTKDVKRPSLVSNLSSKTQPDKSSATAYSPKRHPHVKQVEGDNKSTPSTNAVSTSAVFSIGLTKLHPAHYNPKSSDSSPKSTPSNTATVQSLDMRVNPIPKPRRQKPGLTPSTTKENKENPVEGKLNQSNGGNSSKTTGALSERQDAGDTPKTEWQLEAERRIAARRGKYIDPETHLVRFLLPDSAKPDNEKNGDANRNIQNAGQKKISLTQDWTFNDDSLNSSSSLDFPYRKHILPKQDLDSLDWSNPKKRLSTDEIQKELMDIDSKLTDLELRGRQLEVSIRADIIEFSDELPYELPYDCTDSVLPLNKGNLDSNEDEEKFMVEWFQLINEKNELVRRENDLIYQSQEQELEEEQIRIDKELQALMKKPYEKKSKAEKRKEEELIQKKIAVVNQRNLIVDSIDEDRLRYQEEDEGIKEVLQSKGYLRDELPC